MPADLTEAQIEEWARGHIAVTVRDSKGGSRDVCPRCSGKSYAPVPWPCPTAALIGALREVNGRFSRVALMGNEALDRAEAAEARVREAEELIETIDLRLHIPAAEYVPAIGDVFKLIDKHRKEPR